MLVQLCDRCGRVTSNSANLMVPRDDHQILFLEVANIEYNNRVLTLCNYCLKDFDEFRYRHDRFNSNLTNDKEV